MQTTNVIPVSRRPKVSLWLLRALVSAGAITVFAQPVLAGGYLAGEFDFLAYHEGNSHAIIVVVLGQMIAAAMYWLIGRGSALPLVLSIVQWLLVVFQQGMGYARGLATHIPLGVVIVVLALAICVWVWRPRAAAPRPRFRGPQGSAE